MLIALGDETGIKSWYEQALEESNEGLKRAPDDVDARFIRGVAEFKLGREQQALSLFRKLAGEGRSPGELAAYIHAAETEVETARRHKRVGVVWRILLALAAAANLVGLWWAFIAGRLSEGVLVGSVPLLLGVIGVAALLPHLTRFKVATVEAQLEVLAYDVRQETLSGPSFHVAVKPWAAPIDDHRAFEH